MFDISGTHTQHTHTSLLYHPGALEKNGCMTESMHGLLDLCREKNKNIYWGCWVVVFFVSNKWTTANQVIK